MTVTMSNQANVKYCDADSACYVLHLEDTQFSLCGVDSKHYRIVMVKPKQNMHVVTLKPRDFKDTARHIRRITTPIDWPIGG
jgi:hypothetical protein